MKSTETWRSIDGFEGYYEVSSLARVKSLKRVVKRSNDWPITIKERVLHLNTNNNGYYTVSLQDKNGKRHERTVHRLFAKVFLPNPQQLPMINHMNGIKTDNSIENLEWVTASQNLSHAYRIGLKKMSEVAKAKFIEHNRTKIVSQETRLKQSIARKKYFINKKINEASNIL